MEEWVCVYIALSFSLSLVFVGISNQFFSSMATTLNILCMTRKLCPYTHTHTHRSRTDDRVSIYDNITRKRLYARPRKSIVHNSNNSKKSNEKKQQNTIACTHTHTHVRIQRTSFGESGMEAEEAFPLFQHIHDSHWYSGMNATKYPPLKLPIFVDGHSVRMRARVRAAKILYTHSIFKNALNSSLYGYG